MSSSNKLWVNLSLSLALFFVVVVGVVSCLNNYYKWLSLISMQHFVMATVWPFIIINVSNITAKVSGYSVSSDIFTRSPSGESGNVRDNSIYIYTGLSPTWTLFFTIMLFFCYFFSLSRFILAAKFLHAKNIWTKIFKCLKLDGLWRKNNNNIHRRIVWKKH